MVVGMNNMRTYIYSKMMEYIFEKLLFDNESKEIFLSSFRPKKNIKTHRHGRHLKVSKI